MVYRFISVFNRYTGIIKLVQCAKRVPHLLSRQCWSSCQVASIHQTFWLFFFWLLRLRGFYRIAWCSLSANCIRLVNSTKLMAKHYWWYYGQTPFLSPACLKQHWPGTIFKWHSLQTFRDLLRLMTQLVNIIFMPQCFLCPLPTISSFSALVSCESLMIIIQRCFDRITCQYLHTYINRVLLPLWFV